MPRTSASAARGRDGWGRADDQPGRWSAAWRGKGNSILRQNTNRSGTAGARDLDSPSLGPVSIPAVPSPATVLLALALSGPWIPAFADAQPTRPCTVQRVIDGDTFVCGDDERVRLLLVNTPEMSDEPLGRLAREFVLGVMPPGARVRLELDVQERDRYGRLLAYVWLPDGRMLNRVLARNGYAQVMVIPPNVDRVEEMRGAVRAAREEGAGLWDREYFREKGMPEGGAWSGHRKPPRGGACEPAYPDVCIPPPPPDLDCADVSVRRFRVVGGDPHHFDGDGDGVGCESRYTGASERSVSFSVVA